MSANRGPSIKAFMAWAARCDNWVTRCYTALKETHTPTSSTRTKIESYIAAQQYIEAWETMFDFARDCHGTDAEFWRCMAICLRLHHAGPDE